MSEVKPIAMTKFVLGALASVLILNLILLAWLGLGGPATIGIAIGVAGLVSWWFARAVGRTLLPQERTRFLWLYGGTIAAVFIANVLLASLRSAPSVVGVFILFLYYIPYPAFAQMFLADKYVAMSLRK